MINCLHSCKDEFIFRNVVFDFCRSIQDQQGDIFKKPSLLYLLKFWQDPISIIYNMLTIIVDVSYCARFLFESTLKIISSEVKNDFINYFVQNSIVYLTKDVSKSKRLSRACIMVASMGVYDSTLLTNAIAKDITASLENIIRNESDSARLLAIDIFGMGFSIWFLHLII
jgi:hypothetical protein